MIDKLRRTDSLEDIKDVVPVDKSWDSDEDSDTSGIAEEDEDGLRSGSGSLNSARVVLETEIKFNEETAITMTILEDQGKNSKRETSKYDDDDQREVDEKDVRVEIDDRAQEDRRKNTRYLLLTRKLDVYEFIILAKRGSSTLTPIGSNESTQAVIKFFFTTCWHRLSSINKRVSIAL